MVATLSSSHPFVASCTLRFIFSGVVRITARFARGDADRENVSSLGSLSARFREEWLVGQVPVLPSFALSGCVCVVGVGGLDAAAGVAVCWW
jgi:hypothetical protein